MKACPDHEAPAGLPPGVLAAPWRWPRSSRPGGLVRASRTAAICRLWRHLFPVRAAHSALADLLADIAPYVLRRAGRGTRHRRMPPAASRQSGWHGSHNAPCGGVPVAARAGSGR
ncbi:hypothetical protein [Pseudoduganella chitinolytica]|uniref:Uncharacterized protein n=1 Tax=Pseudoduganella chitinolytica TaxID=34070 RepID=A0ABY8BF39_9BURK|nr:hypothetical protein [Pseudoduganella chitinolytica]WEF34530.1 hypothetical protein PX653_07130 [Pseudoduganella chitinolytica]